MSFSSTPYRYQWGSMSPGAWRGPKLYCKACDRHVNPVKDKHCLAFYSSDFTPCGCQTHALAGVPCTAIERTRTVGQVGVHESNRIRCMNCGKQWNESLVPLRNENNMAFSRVALRKARRRP